MQTNILRYQHSMASFFQDKKKAIAANDSTNSNSQNHSKNQQQNSTYSDSVHRGVHQSLDAGNVGFELKRQQMPRGKLQNFSKNLNDMVNQNRQRNPP